MLIIFLKAILIGLSVAMPIGPISTLAIKNCLTRGFAIGFATSFGASITEGFYGFVATIIAIPASNRACAARTDDINA